MLELSRDVYLDSCSKIALRLKEYDFKYAKSGPHLTKKVNDLKFKISFSSSHYNVAGSNIRIEVYLHVESTKIKKFRSQFPQMVACSQIAVTNIGSLEPRLSNQRWNLADAAQRTSIIDDIVERIKLLAIPFFDSFENSNSISQMLIDDYVHYIHSMDSVITYLLFFSSEDMAKKAIRSRLISNPNEVAPYKEALIRYSNANLNDVKVYGFVEDMAYFSVFLSWGDLSPISPNKSLLLTDDLPPL